MSEQSKAGQYLPLCDWTVNGSESSTAIWVQGEHGKRVATVINRENDADIAALISAAPDLLAALERIIKESDGGWRRESDTAKLAIYAILKAKVPT